MRKRKNLKSPIWQVSREEFQKLVDNCDSATEILQHFGMKNIGSNYTTLNRRIQCDNIDLSKLKSNKKESSLPYFILNKTPLDQILVENSSYSRTHLKTRLLKEKFLHNKCYECGLDSEWNGKKLSLQLDHINGINNDNRLENLRMLCPNCHSQTDNFAGRANRNKLPKVKVNKNAPKFKLRKVERPSKEDLAKMLWEMPTVKIAKQYGVSDKAVEKWAKSYGIAKPPRGHWGFKNNVSN